MHIDYLPKYNHMLEHKSSKMLFDKSINKLKIYNEMMSGKPLDV